jgi:hypothetical protein
MLASGCKMRLCCIHSATSLACGMVASTLQHNLLLAAACD